jgi:hypothetical protein
MRFLAGTAAALAASFIAGAALAQPAAPSPPDPERLRLAHQVLEAQGGTEAYKAQLTRLFSTISEMVKRNAPPDKTGLTDALFKYAVDEEIDAAPQMLDDAAQIFAEHLTEQELRDLLAWSTSDSARSIRLKQPEMTQEILLRQEPLMKRVMAGTMQKAVEKLCADKHCTEQEKQTLTAIVAKVAPPAS